MEKSKKITSIKDILPNSIYNNEYKYTFIMKLINNNWDEIIGLKLKDYTKPLYIKNKILYIGCKHSGIIQSLTNYNKEIISRLKERIKEININEIKYVYSN